jgi:hypothetical protein
MKEENKHSENCVREERPAIQGHGTRQEITYSAIKYMLPSKVPILRHENI